MPTTTRVRAAALAAVLAAGALAAALHARQATSRPAVEHVRLPLDLPAMGNLDAVTQWRLGRIEDAEQAPGSTDVVLRIRLATGVTVNVVGPAVLVDLARASRWLPAAQARPDRATFVERMVAFDADANGRLVAMISLEPIERSERALERLYGR